MDFDRMNDVITEFRYNFKELEIFYHLKLNFGLDQLKYSENIKKQLTRLMSIIKAAYSKKERELDIGFITDVACENKNEILNNEDFTEWDLLRLCGEEL